MAAGRAQHVIHVQGDKDAQRVAREAADRYQPFDVVGLAPAHVGGRVARLLINGIGRAAQVGPDAHRSIRMIPVKACQDGALGIRDNNHAAPPKVDFAMQRQQARGPDQHGRLPGEPAVRVSQALADDDAVRWPVLAEIDAQVVRRIIPAPGETRQAGIVRPRIRDQGCEQQLAVRSDQPDIARWIGQALNALPELRPSCLRRLGINLVLHPLQRAADRIEGQRQLAGQGRDQVALLRLRGATGLPVFRPQRPGDERPHAETKKQGDAGDLPASPMGLVFRPALGSTDTPQIGSGGNAHHGCSVFRVDSDGARLGTSLRH